jgi:hypothetical protein
MAVRISDLATAKVYGCSVLFTGFQPKKTYGRIGGEEDTPDMEDGDGGPLSWLVEHRLWLP